jgi:hypothetical protein
MQAPLKIEHAAELGKFGGRLRQEFCATFFWWWTRPIASFSRKTPTKMGGTFE